MFNLINYPEDFMSSLISFCPLFFLKTEMDFRNSIATTGVNIPEKIINHLEMKHNV